MIEQKSSKNWKELQNNVTKILIESGLEAESPKEINTVRGSVEIDVFAVDYSIHPASIYLCECKYWRKKIDQGEVFKFRTIVSDYGANWGLIISSKGFQSGSYEAIKNSNIKLLDWNEFQNLFFERWYLNYFCPELRKEAEPLIDYTEQNI